jgi:hypothetical protein
MTNEQLIDKLHVLRKEVIHYWGTDSEQHRKMFPVIDGIEESVSLLSNKDGDYVYFRGQKFEKVKK